MAALEAVTPVEAVLLALHGAAVSETVHDIEGDLLAAARALVGPDVPVVATLDLHAHITEAMVTNADGLVAWETYPHRDSYTTGRRGAGLVVDAGPVVLVETADACGGGAAGDSIACIAALLEHAPDAVSVAPVVGPTAVLRAGGLQIVIATHPTYEWTGEQYSSVGVDVTAPKFAVVKNPMNYRMVYPDAPVVIVIDSPGPTPASVRSLPFERMQRPFFPLDDNIARLRPTVFA